MKTTNDSLSKEDPALADPQDSSWKPMLLEAEKNGTLETLARGIPMEELPELIEWVMEKIQSPDYPLDLSEMIIHDYLIREFNCRSDEPYGAWRLNHGNKKRNP